jgi:Holliday junction resolvasome RuvABC endonuclease subunit
MVGRAVDLSALQENKTLQSGDFTINGVSFDTIELSSRNDTKQNLQLVIDAINKKTTETGVMASLNSRNNGIVLSNTSGMSFTVSGRQSSLIGLINGTYTGVTTTTNGIFSRLDAFGERVNGYLSESLINLVDTKLKSEVTHLTNSIQKVLDRLNSKYEVMTAQFASYNAIISRYEASFNGVRMLIEQSSNKSNS